MPRSLLTADEIARVNAAVAAAEARTDAEIVPVVAAASGRYDRAEDVVGLWAAGAAVAAVWLLWPEEPTGPGRWAGPWAAWQLPALLAAGLVAFVCGAAAAGRLWVLRRPFVPAAQARDEVAARARGAFFDGRVHHTAAGCGLMIFVSLDERRAAVLADRGLRDALGESAERELCDALTAALRTKSPADALCDAVAAAGDRLSAARPRTAGKPNELPDALVLLSGPDEYRPLRTP